MTPESKEKLRNEFWVWNDYFLDANFMDSETIKHLPHPCRETAAFLILEPFRSKESGTNSIVLDTTNSEIVLDVDLDKLAEADSSTIKMLAQCGVRFYSEEEALCLI